MLVFSEDLSQLFMLIPNDSTNHLKYAVLERVFSFKVPLLAFLVVGVAVVMYWGSDAGDHRGTFRAVNVSWRGAQSPGGRWNGVTPLLCGYSSWCKMQIGMG